MLEFVEVPLGSGGSGGCARCSRPETPHYRPSFEVAAEVEAACRAWGRVAGPNVALVGPEPFASEELPAIVTAAVTSGVKRLRLDTDAAALGHPDSASKVLAAGVRHIRSTLLAGSAEAHDALAGKAGVFDSTVAGLLQFAAQAESSGIAVSLTARVPACRHNMHELPGAVIAAAETGVRYVLLEVADPALDISAAMPWIAAACDSGTVNSVWVEVAGVPYCLAGSHGLHLTPLMRTLAVGAKPESCSPCALGDVCAGVAAETSPQVFAALAPPAMEAALAESIRRAFVSPSGPGEAE
jgi:hypothetical protein